MKYFTITYQMMHAKQPFVVHKLVVQQHLRNSAVRLLEKLHQIVAYTVFVGAVVTVQNKPEKVGNTIKI